MENHLERLRHGAKRLAQENAGVRIARLRRLRDAVARHRPALHEAFQEDLGKGGDAVDLSELLTVGLEIEHAIAHVRAWMKPRRVGGPVPFWGTSSELHVQPKGASLIVAAWNYPFLLTIGPLVSAIAAGCSAALKPSEFTPSVGAAVAEMLSGTFSDEEVRVVQGGEDVSGALTAQPWDHIYFTGSSRVGSLVMASAAKNLTSVTLELGGKSPTIVDETADLDRAAQRIAFGKFSNTGQTCIAPDYVYVHASRHDALVDALRRAVRSMYPEGMSSPDYQRVISSRHHARLAAMCADATIRGAAVSLGGEADSTALEIAPTLLTDVPEDSVVMQEEIFGPVLPILPYASLEEVVEGINSRPAPLSLYVFSNRRQTVREILARTRSGGVVINDTVLQFANPHLPFGGIGQSGMGRGHGYWGFLEFSNLRSVLRQRRRFPLTRLLHPPYTGARRRLIGFLLRRYGLR